MECSGAWVALERPVDAALLERAGRHVERCAACQARLERDAMPAGMAERFRAPPELAARIGAGLDGAARAAVVAARRGFARRLAALAAAFLIGAVLAGGYATRLAQPGEELAAHAVSAHIGAQLAGRRLQVASSDQ